VAGPPVEVPPNPPPGRPAAEFPIDEALVRALLEAQHPDLAGLPLRRAGEGWDNATFRLGDKLAVRLPRRAAAAELVEHEQRWLPLLAERLPLSIPVPVRAGQPGSGYPWRWSVVPWLAGQPAGAEPPPVAEAAVLGTFLHALHVDAPTDAPANPYRGVPLSRRAASVRARMARLGELGDAAAAVTAAFDEALATPIDAGRTWLHGDLHPQNILVAGGAISAVVDWGDLTAGDPATDLAAAWMLWPPQQHDAFWDAYGGVSDATRQRARGWAVFFGVVLLDVGLADRSSFAAVGRRTLAHVGRR